MDKLTAIKIKHEDGTYSDQIPVSVLGENVEWDATHTLVDILGSINVGITGTIQDQISQLFNEKVSATQLQNYVASQLNEDVSTWLNNNVDPVGSAVIVDSSLTISGAAADARAAGQIVQVIAPAYDSTKTYAVGNIVSYDGSFYKCLIEITTPEAWTAAHWTAATVGTELNDIKGDVTGLKEDFNSIMDYTVSPNLLDVSALTPGYLRNNGTITQYGDWVTTDFIPVETGKIYTPSCTNNSTRGIFTIFFRAEYDENNQMITGTYADSGAYSYTITSENAKYVRFSYHNTAETERCFVEGIDVKYYPYGEKYYKVDEEAFPDDVKADLSVVDAVRTRNLFDKNAVVDGYISNSSGAITVSGDWVTSDYIPVEYGKQYTCSTDFINPYGTYFMLEVDEDKSAITYQQASPRFPYSPSAPSVKYIRFSVHSSNLPTLVYEESTQGKGIYTPYGYFLNAPYKSLLYGKKWVAVGDSLTEKNVSAISNYTDFISVLNNMDIVNKGVGGTGYMRGYDTNIAFYQRVANLPDCDIITIFGSGNDLAYYSDLGDVTDATTTTICGCINETLDVIFENHPTTPLLVIAPTPWAGNTPDMTTGMAVYCEKLQAICARRGVAYLDLFHHSGLRPDDDNQNSLVFYDGSLDGHSNYVHPNKLGHSIIAPRIMQAMESIMIF